MKFFTIILVIGLIGTIISIVSAVVYHFHYWYSFFVISSFLLFDSLDFFISKRSLIENIRLHGLKHFFLVYGIFALVGGVVADIFYGRVIASAWIYPYLGSYSMFLVPIFIYYPFGGLSVFTLYRVLRGLLHKRFHYNDKYVFTLPRKYLTVTLAIFSIPVINFLFNRNFYAIETTTLMGGALLSILFWVVFRKNKLVLSAIFITTVLSVILHEVPNLYVGEWIYQNIPLSEIQIFRIPLLIVIAWLLLPLGVNDMIEKEKKWERLIR